MSIRRCLRIAVFACLGVSLGAGAGGAAAPGPGAAGPPARAPKYLLVLFADGMGAAHIELGRMAKRVLEGEGFVLTDEIAREGHMALVTTHSANSLTTDSAAAATALATGQKVCLWNVGTDCEGRPLRNVAEAARGRGMRIAVATDAEVSDASPAAFLAHAKARGNFTLILEQYLALQPDVLMGGGLARFLPKGMPGSRRRDDRDFLEAFRGRGYEVVSTLPGLRRASAPRILGLFAPGDLPFALDRDPERDPTVADLAEAVLRLLEGRSPRGFLAFVETEHPDTASHETDAAALLGALREFDRALRAAVAFYRRHPEETLLLVLSDHETGGLSLAFGPRGLDRPREMVFPTEAHLRRLAGIRLSLDRAAGLLGPAPDDQALDRLMRDHFPGFLLAPEIRAALKARRCLVVNLCNRPVHNLLGMMVAQNTQVWWGTAQHTAQPVPIFALGVGAERFRGYLDNAEVGRRLLELLESGP